MGHSQPFAKKVTLVPMKDGAILGEACWVACPSTMPCMMTWWTNQAAHDSLMWGQEMALSWMAGSQISGDRSALSNQEDLCNLLECKERDRNNEVAGGNTRWMINTQTYAQLYQCAQKQQNISVLLGPHFGGGLGK